MKTLKIANTAAFAAMVALNMFANLFALGGKTTGQVSDAYPNLFTPVGMTFSVWGVIYLLLGMFILFQWGVFGYTNESERLLGKIGVLFIISCIANILWILCWHSGAIELSVICIIALLIVLIFIQRRIKSVPAGAASRLTVNAGFDIYLGWIIAATIANISVWLVKIDWNRFGLSESFWTVAVLLGGAAIGSRVVTVGKNWLAGCALIWAYTGILIKHVSNTGYSAQYPAVIAAAIIGIAGIWASILLVLTRPSLPTQEETP